MATVRVQDWMNHKERHLTHKLNRRIKKMDKATTVEVAGSAETTLKAVMDSVERFKNHFTEVESHFLERAGELEQIKYALLTKEHVLLKGKPGTAKSKLAKYSFGYVQKANTFSIQLSKFMSEEYLFGAIDINKMRNEGKVEHITAGSIVDCEFAFIDEVFDGNDALLRSLLEVLNERTFTRHTQKINAKLHTSIMTSNYVREDECTEAFLDRILFKSDVRQIGQNKNRMHMYKKHLEYGVDEHKHISKALNGNAITYEELNTLANFILSINVEIPEPVLKLYDMVVKEYTKQLNCYISDRKANKMLNILKASAVLNQRTTAHFEDIEPIKYALTTLNNDQQEEVFRAVFTKLMQDNVKYDRACSEIEKLDKVFQALVLSVTSKMNPKSTEILELNEEAQHFQEILNQHNFKNGSGFTDTDTKFNEIFSGTDKIIREVAKTLKLSNK